MGGPKAEPCGTPFKISIQLLITDSVFTLCFQFEK